MGVALITGGSGYIGSNTVAASGYSGRPVVVLDNLSRGSRRLIPEDVPFYEGDAGDPRMLKEIFHRHRVEAVVHFAGDIVVPESVATPLAYYLNNTCKDRKSTRLNSSH